MDYNELSIIKARTAKGEFYAKQLAKIETLLSTLTSSKEEEIAISLNIADKKIIDGVEKFGPVYDIARLNKQVAIEALTEMRKVYEKNFAEV